MFYRGNMLKNTVCTIRIDQCLVEPSTHAVVTYLLLDESFASFFSLTHHVTPLSSFKNCAFTCFVNKKVRQLTH